jgi:hypothetical protein
LFSNQAQEKAPDNGPHRLQHERSGSQRLSFGFGRSFAGLNFSRLSSGWLSLIRDFKSLLYAGGELPEQLPGNFFNHPATELDYFSDEVHIRADDDPRPGAIEGRDFAQHSHLC